MREQIAFLAQLSSGGMGGSVPFVYLAPWLAARSSPLVWNSRGSLLPEGSEKETGAIRRRISPRRHLIRGTPRSTKHDIEFSRHVRHAMRYDTRYGVLEWKMEAGQPYGSLDIAF